MAFFFFFYVISIICVWKEDLVPVCLRQFVRSKTKEESTTMIQLKTVCVLVCVHARVCICAFSLQNFTSSEGTFITYFLNLSLH